MSQRNRAWRLRMPWWSRPGRELGAVVAPWLAAAGLATSTLCCVAAGDTIFVDGFEPGDCAMPLTCPTPQAGKSCIAGQLSDAGTTQPLHATSNVYLTCADGAAGGPCDLVVSAYDALAYETNPAASVPLASGATVVDGCGRFRLSDLTASTSGGVAIVAADSQTASGHTPTATLRALAANQAVTEVNAVVATSATFSNWLFLGQIADTTHGVILLTYTTGGTPTAAVTIGYGSPVGAIRYFSDADSQRLLASQSATSTGPDGSVLAVNSPYQSFSGTSAGIPCASVMTASLPGIVVFAELACSP